MELVSEPKIDKWWVGKRGSCNKCGRVWKCESNDNVQPINVSGDLCVAGYCPVCVTVNSAHYTSIFAAAPRPTVYFYKDRSIDSSLEKLEQRLPSF